MSTEVNKILETVSKSDPKYFERLAEAIANDIENEIQNEVHENEDDSTEVEASDIEAELEVDNEIEDSSESKEENEEQVENHETSNSNSYAYGNDGTKWSKSPPASRRFMSHNVLKCTGDPTTGNGCELEIFERFFSNDIKEIILCETNKHAKKVYDLSKQVWTPMTMAELEGFVGILIYAGATHNNTQAISELWIATNVPCVEQRSKNKKVAANFVSRSVIEAFLNQTIQEPKDILSQESGPEVLKNKAKCAICKDMDNVKRNTRFFCKFCKNPVCLQHSKCDYTCFK